MLKKLLIANRGEIARRIMRACRTLNIQTVAIYAEPDTGAAWLAEADERYPLPGVSAAETYLNQKAILQIAREAGADSIHPGYGFLSENDRFARACQAAGLIFVGPPAGAIALMGSKARARELAIAAGVPVIPGVDTAGMNEASLAAAAEEIGYPVLVKASAGGGGKGMRIVWSAEELAGAVQAARGEAASAFGDDHLLLEKYIAAGRHVEVQVLADKHGQVVHLHERDCSIQRRYQKIIEETPAPGVPAAVLAALTEAAVALARAVDYESAGTVEFVLAPDNAFYLLEMNTRLQVEHPVTELLTGLDLVSWQLRIAAGEQLALPDGGVPRQGHALECRLYAEDPAAGFLPSIGEVSFYRRPAGPGIRVDDGIASGSRVTPYYDPMLAKIITWGADREEARRRMIAALEETIVLGVATNIPYLLAILHHEQFIAGGVTTHFLENELAEWQPAAPADDLTLAALAAAELFASSRPSPVAAAGQPAPLDPWATVGRWRNV